MAIKDETLNAGVAQQQGKSIDLDRVIRAQKFLQERPPLGNGAPRGCARGEA